MLKNSEQAKHAQIRRHPAASSPAPQGAVSCGEGLARGAGVSLGHSHNVRQRLGDVAWVERDDRQRIRLMKPADLLESWCESYPSREKEIPWYVVPEKVPRRFMAELARVATAEG